MLPSAKSVNTNTTNGMGGAGHFLLNAATPAKSFTREISVIEVKSGTVLVVSAKKAISDRENASDYPDYAVDVYYELTAPQITKKLAVLDYHVTQFADQLKARGKNHYTIRPYEYFITGFEKLNNGSIATKEYLNLLLA